MSEKREDGAPLRSRPIRVVAINPQHIIHLALVLRLTFQVKGINYYNITSFIFQNNEVMITTEELSAILERYPEGIKF